MASRSQVSPVIALRARQHRCALTSEEQLLWLHISGCRLGVWFRRQVPVRNFIVDFLAPSARLIVEVDGGYDHTRITANARRDAKLARMGYRVLRLESDMVCHHIDTAIDLIRDALAQQ